MCDGNAKMFFLWSMENKLNRNENVFPKWKTFSTMPHSYTQQTTTNVFFDNFPKNESFPETFFNILYLVNPFLL